MIIRQFRRWLIVGVSVNSVLYISYLLLTRSLLEPRTAMSAVYVVGVAIGFVGNKYWAFEHTGATGGALFRYFVAYAVGYAINYAGLQFGIEVMRVPHEAVQGAMVFIVAATMFFMQKYFVFVGRQPAAPSVTSRQS